MQPSGSEDLLYINGNKENYAVEFSSVIELCTGLLITKVPCFPSFFQGICNYKGSMIPVVKLEECPAKEGTEPWTLILQWDRYVLGILCWQEPFAAMEKEAVQIYEHTDTASSDIWKKKGLIRQGEKLYFLVDLEKTMEALVLSK